jgi:hypothetical protein
MRVFMTLLTIAGNFAATVALMLSLSTMTNVGLTSTASAEPTCDPRHYFCFPCRPPKLINLPACRDGCCGQMPEGTKPE